jgi:AcrR family transcriptional regulator
MQSSLSTFPQNRRIAAETVCLPPGLTPKGARGKILNAALRLFAQHGYGATSVRDICKEAKVQTTTLYSHFPSKESVLAEIVQLGHSEHLRRLRDALLLCKQQSPAEQLSAIVRAHVISHCEYSMLAVVTNTEMHALSDDAVRPAMEILQESESLLGDVLQRCSQRSIFDVPDIELALRAIGGMGMRVAFWYEPNCGKTPEYVADTFADFAMRLMGITNDQLSV